MVVHGAQIQDRDGARQVLSGCREQFPRLTHIWADGGYAGQLQDWAQQAGGWTLEIVEKPKDQKGFSVLPRRWVVERTLAWIGRNRRLAKEYDLLPQTSQTWIYLAMTRLMLNRLAT